MRLYINPRLSAALALSAIFGPFSFQAQAQAQAQAQTQSQESAATTALKAREHALRKDVVQVADGVYVAVGYSPANISFIVGETGLIIVDTGMAPAHAAEALAAFREISSLPVAAIILTHGHGDHTGGAAVFAQETEPQVWAHKGFGAEGSAFSSAGLTVQNQRGARQGGFLLPPEQRINNGIARTFYPQQAQGGRGEVFAGNQTLAPTHRLSRERERIEIAGVTLDLVAAPGETEDQLYVWLPGRKVLFSGDNFYASWPNIYAIRGTPYRDMRGWADANGMMLSEGALHLVPGHTRPISGAAKVAEALTDYRDAIRYVFDKTVEGMNKGMTPDELVAYARLPDTFAEKDHLREFYGNVEWAVRSIFTGYLGWFDGNPTTLFSFTPKEEAERMALIAGGRDGLLAYGHSALANDDPQWAAELADHAIALDREDPAALLLKADALTMLAEDLLTATGRNYYLTSAQELRQTATALQDQ